MQVILLQKIRKLGNFGETVTVKPGYGRNYLLPKHLAVPASSDNLAKFESRRAELEKAAADKLQKAQNRASYLGQVSVTIPVQAGEEGRLYGSVGAKEIAQALEAAGHQVDKNEVRLDQGALRQTGEYDIALQLHSDVSVTVKVILQTAA